MYVIINLISYIVEHYLNQLPLNLCNFQGICAILLRIFWSTVLVIILAFSTLRLSQCPNGSGLLSYLFLSLFVFLLSIICEACLVNASLVGSIVETSKRDEGLEKYLTAHIVLGIMQLILAIFGILVISSRSVIPCVNDLQNTQKYDLILLTVIVFTQFIDFFSLVCCCYCFSTNEDGEGSLKDDLYITTEWESQCKSGMKSFQILSCNLFGGSNIEMDLKSVAKVFTKFFHHDGFLDIVVGIYLWINVHIRSYLKLKVRLPLLNHVILYFKHRFFCLSWFSWYHDGCIFIYKYIPIHFQNLKFVYSH